VNVAICGYGAGNVRSVEIALRRLGASLSDDVTAADVAVFPGVGSARAAMAGLRERGHDEALRERFTAGRPILGICLGLQLALDWTEEDGGVEGLGLVPGRALRLRGGRVHATEWSEGVVAEARFGSFVGCQFHPEKSGALGERYLEEALSLSRV